MAIGIGIGFSGWPFGDPNPEAFRRAIDLAESLDIDSLWLSDRVVSEVLSLEPVVALSWVAARTRKMKFGTSVLALPLRNPTVLAKELATLDFLSGGRLLLAVGLGRDEESEPRACGIARSERAGRTEEAVHLLRALWSGNEVSFQGRFYQLDKVSIQPRPARTAPPIWVGGRSGAAFRRAARLADGWLGSQMTPEEVGSAITRIRGHAAEYGRAIDQDHFGVLFNFCFAEDPAAGARLARPHALRNRPEVDFVQTSALGSADDITDMVRRYMDAGASKFVARPACPPEAVHEQIERLGTEVVPRCLSW